MDEPLEIIFREKGSYFVPFKYKLLGELTVATILEDCLLDPKQ